MRESNNKKKYNKLSSQYCFLLIHFSCTKYTLISQFYCKYNENNIIQQNRIGTGTLLNSISNISREIKKKIKSNLLHVYCAHLNHQGSQNFVTHKRLSLSDFAKLLIFMFILHWIILWCCSLNKCYFF